MITQQRLKDLFHYNPDTGVFVRKVSTCNRVKVGDTPGTKTKPGYIVMYVDANRHMAHRLAWLYVYGTFPSKEIDHINGVGTDNRISNLREASSAENKQNLHIHRKQNKLGVLGVSKSRGKFMAELQVNGVRALRKRFDLLEDAVFAYSQAKKKFHPFATEKI